MSKSLYSYLGLNVTSSSSTSISLALSSFLSINTVRNSFIVNLGLLGSCNIRYTYSWIHHIYLQLVSSHIFTVGFITYSYSWFITYIYSWFITYIYSCFITYIYSWFHHIYLHLVYHIYLQLVSSHIFTVGLSHIFTVGFYHIHVCLNLFFYPIA